ncbi:MAG: MCE family protein [Calditrichaeota bacterium]|nr:MAG: MCE family protein [Calditrichota bacterium]
MEYKSSEVKAGIFIIASLIIFTVFLAIIIGVSSFEEKVEYKARFGYVGGIEKGSAVRFAGLPVGSVVDVRLPGNQYPGVEVVMEIEKNTPIRAGSRAFMTTIGIMGSFYIEITAGTQDDPLLPPGSFILAEDVTAYAQLSGVASDAAEELAELLRRLNDLLNENNRNEMSQMIHSINQIAAVSERNLQLSLESVNGLVLETQSLIAALRAMVENNDQSITNSVALLENMLVQSKASIERLDSILKNVDESMIQNQGQYNQIMDNLNSLTKNLDDFSRTVKEHPWSLVRKTYPPERELP